jgi:hypothetical protein
MAAAKKSVERGGNDLLLADDDFANFVLERADARRELVKDGYGIAVDDWWRCRKSRRRLLEHKNVICPKVSAKYGTLQAFPTGPQRENYDKGWLESCTPR